MTHEINSRLTAKFATLNKHSHLEDYEEQCGKDEETDYINWRYETCTVEQSFILTEKEYRELIVNLLDPSILFRGKGGNTYTGKDETVANDENFWKYPAKLEEFRANNDRLVTVIENKDTNEIIVIDPQGHDYARYVGINPTAI